MPNRTITALYDSKEDAEQAKQGLRSAGLNGDIDIHGASEGESEPQTGGGFLSGLKQMFGAHDDHQTYAEGLRQGSFLLTAQIDDAQADMAIRVLESTNAIDLDKRETEWRGAGWTGGSTNTKDFTSRADLPQAGKTAAISAQNSGQEQVIPLIEEQLKIGKREVERGGVRVRSYIIETPVHEQVSLREERVTLERRPVNQPTANADTLLQNREIELTETAEEAVVAKDAVVREELVLRKDTTQRTEEINQTVRRTEVDVQDQRTAKPGTPATPPRI